MRNKERLSNAARAKIATIQSKRQVSLRTVASVAFIFLLFSNAAHAQTGLKPSSSAPIEITADGSLEWNRNEKLFIARDNALAKQADTSIKAATLTAHYRDGKGGGMDISKVLAETNVELKSKDSTAYGQKADYDLDKGLAVMTGDNLRLTAPEQNVTASERFEYWVTEGKLVAVGNAKVDRKNERGETNTLQADTISAILKDDAKGQRNLDSAQADGNVVIITPAERVTGQHGTYNARTGKAILTGGVKILRGPNVLEGDRAEVDMNTNISQLFGGPAATTQTGSKTGGQVRGVFYPGSEKSGSAVIPPPAMGVPLPSASPEKTPPLTAPDDDLPPLLTVE